MNSAPAHRISKRGRVGEGRPSLYTPELASRLADHIAAGLTDEESAALEDISPDCIQRWRKGNPEFRATIKKAEAQRLKLRLAKIEQGSRLARHSMGSRAYLSGTLCSARGPEPDRRGESFRRKGNCPARGGVRRPYRPSRLSPAR